MKIYNTIYVFAFSLNFSRTEPTDFCDYTKGTVDLTTTDDPFKAIEANGTHTSAAQSAQTIESLYDTPKQLYKDTSSNHVGNSVPHYFQSHDPNRLNSMTANIGENGKELSDLDKKRLHFRRSPSYTNAISVDSDLKDVNTLTAEEPPTYMDVSPKRCPSYSQAVEESPLLTKGNGEKHNTKTKYFDGKYYVGVVNDTDESAL